MKKRLVSMILSAVLFATSVPVAAFAEDANTQNPVMHSEEGTSQGSNARKESGIDYKKNGGTFAEGYTAPSNYDEPVTELPGAEQITKAGYEFAFRSLSSISNECFSIRTVIRTSFRRFFNSSLISDSRAFPLSSLSFR